MKKHLALIAQKAPKERHAVIVVDGELGIKSI
jgi:hypothetical protein